MLCNKRSHDSEKPLLITTREHLNTAVKTQRSQKINLIKKNKKHTTRGALIIGTKLGKQGWYILES